jgi:hypothetical protein
VPLFLDHGFVVAPLVHRGPVDREFTASLPLGRLRRTRETGVDLVEIEFARYRRAAFRIQAGVAPKGGMMTFTGHWAAEDLYVGWLNEYFEMYASPRRRTWFSVRHWPWQTVVQDDYGQLAQRVSEFTPELESALRDSRLGPHMRRVVISRPGLPAGQQ